MTTRFYPVQSHADLKTAIWDMVKWLINDPTHGLTGPNWSIVEAWDNGGEGLAIPVDGHDVSTFASPTFNWRTGNLALGDFIILESDVGVAGKTMQVYLEYDTTTVMHVALLPLANWPTATASGSPPDAELNGAKAVGDGGTFPGAYINMTGYTFLADYTIVADEAMMAILFDDNTNACAWIYVGEVTPARSSGTPPDNCPFVILDSTTTVSMLGGAYWNRLSPLDDTTVLIAGYSVEFYCTAGYPLDTGNDVNPFGLWLVLPVGIYFDDFGHRHFMGLLRNIATCNPDKGSKGTIASLAWMYRNDSSGRGICFAWDGATVV